MKLLVLVLLLALLLWVPDCFVFVSANDDDGVVTPNWDEHSVPIEEEDAPAATRECLISADGTQQCIKKTEDDRPIDTIQPNENEAVANHQQRHEIVDEDVPTTDDNESTQIVESVQEEQQKQQQLNNDLNHESVTPQLGESSRLEKQEQQQQQKQQYGTNEDVNDDAMPANEIDDSPQTEQHPIDNNAVKSIERIEKSTDENPQTVIMNDGGRLLESETANKNKNSNNEDNNNNNSREQNVTSFVHIFNSLTEIQDALDTQMLSLSASNLVTFWIVLLVDDDDCSTSIYQASLSNAFEQVATRMTSQRKLILDDTDGHHQQPAPVFAKVKLWKKPSPQEGTTDESKGEKNHNNNNDIVDDIAILFHRFHIQNTPTIAMVVSTGYSADDVDEDNQPMIPSVVEEYKGITYQNIDLMYESILRRYYYYTYLAELGLSGYETTTNTGTYIWKSRSFESLYHVERFLTNRRHTLLSSSMQIASTRQGLSLATSVVERVYIEFLMGWENYTSSVTDADNVDFREKQQSNVTVLTQYRCDDVYREDESNDDVIAYTSYVDYKKLYQTFDTMSNVLIDRRDVLLLVVNQSKELCSTSSLERNLNGAVMVYKIPSLDSDDDMDDFTVSDGWLSAYQTTSTIFKPQQYITRGEPGELIPPTDRSKETNKLHNESLTKWNTLYTHTRLHEFLVKVTSPPSALWFDRETIGPIAFANGRNIHAILFVNMHHSILQELVTQESNSEESYNDYDAKQLIQTILQNDNITQRTKYAVDVFRTYCEEYHQTTLFSEDDPNSAISRDMVCLVVPSTETRILTTLGINYWLPLDQAATSTNGDVTTTILPALVITDQRDTIGTKRYYLDLFIDDTIANNGDDVPSANRILSDTSNRIKAFITDFWNNRLVPHLKSDPRGSRTNKSGVRIITGETAVAELLENDDPSADTATTKLLLLVAPTCGHCKRISSIWNELAKFLRYVGLDSIVKLYRMDVTTNDVELTLNITSNWLPDVYHVAREGKASNPSSRFVRFLSSPDADVVINGGDDGIGTIRDFTDIIEWLLFDIMDGDDGDNRKRDSFLTNEALTQFYSDLKQKF